MAKLLVQGLAVDLLEDEEQALGVLVDGMDLDDIGMLEPGSISVL